MLGHQSLQLAIEEIKKRLATAPLLHPPDMDKDFILLTDTGYCAVLEQKDKGGTEHPIAYSSRATNSAEWKYAQTELGVAALIFALEYFQVYLLGNKVTVFTDHQAFIFPTLPEKPNRRPTSKMALKTGTVFTIYLFEA